MSKSDFRIPNEKFIDVCNELHQISEAMDYLFEAASYYAATYGESHIGLGVLAHMLKLRFDKTLEEMQDGRNLLICHDCPKEQGSAP